MKLHLNKQLFKDAIMVTAEQLNIPPIYIEKDYWITYVLFTIFNNEIGKETIFKGDTALSKCYSLINRFSEDIDLLVIRREGETDAKLKNKIRTIGKVVEAYLPEIKIPGLTQKMGMNRKTAHSYNKEFQGDFGQIRDAIIVEAT
jgi:predicted nucleotidyltransferase component of viral defense system